MSAYFRRCKNFHKLRVRQNNTKPVYVKLFVLNESPELAD